MRMRICGLRRKRVRAGTSMRAITIEGEVIRAGFIGMSLSRERRNKINAKQRDYARGVVWRQRDSPRDDVPARTLTVSAATPSDRERRGADGCPRWCAAVRCRVAMTKDLTDIDA
jgi:hypothetical protein